MVMGYTRMKEFMRRSAGVDVDKSDMDRLTDLIGRKLNDLLVIGVRNASYNNRDVIMEPDLPLTKGILEHLQEFRRYEETIDLKPILDHLAAYPPLERTLSLEVEVMLPELVGTLAMLAGQAMKIIDREVKNPDSDLWDRVLHLMELLL
jgi:Domain of unknown function (DUF1931)